MVALRCGDLHGTGRKPCEACPIHCYAKAEREQMREVMRYSGPRMLLRHPVLAIRHLLDGRKDPPPLKRRPVPEHKP
jgi:hypothetical protein